MKSSRTPKIVIGIGLVAVYSAILSFLILRDGNHNAVAQSEPVAPPTFVDPYATDPALSAADVPAPTEPASIMPAQPAAVPVAPAPVQDSTPKSATAKTASKLSSTDKADSAALPAAASTTSETPVVAQESETPVDTDSRITAEVKSEVAAVDPGGNIDVATRDGVVALTGSVPSQDVIDKVMLVARNVPAVRDVDVSALMVGN